MPTPEKLFENNLKAWSKTCPKEAVLLPYVNSSAIVDCVTDRNEPNIAKNSLIYHSPKSAQTEAETWFNDLTLQDVSLVFVYGIGLGYYYDAIKNWLKKDRQRRLVFFEDDLAIIHKLFGTERGASILKDPQVQLVYFRDLEDKGVFDAFYWNFNMTRLAFTALESYVTFKQKLFSDLRYKIAYDAAIKNALVSEYIEYGAAFYVNFYQNMLSLPRSYRGNHLFGKFCKIPAIICGAGPSLANNIATLGSVLDRALVFAGGSAVNVLNNAGLQPHFGAGIDPNLTQLKRLAENQAYEIPYFYRNRLYHAAFNFIHGPRLYINGAGGYDTADYFEEKLHIKEEWLDEGHNVVNFCTEIAQAMGCDPIIFVGMDLAFTGMKEYAPGVVEDANIQQSTILDVANEDNRAMIRPDINGHPTYTLWKWIAESNWLGTYAKEHPTTTIINCTEGGLGFPGVPNRTLKEVSDDYLVRQYELKDRIHAEIQNVAMPNVTEGKVVKIMRGLDSSLQNIIGHFQIMQDETLAEIEKIKAGEKEIRQSGRAILAETELMEEPAYKAVIEVFNQVYALILSRDVHELNIGRYSIKQRTIKKLQLKQRKYAFLRDVARINHELILYAFEQRDQLPKRKKIATPTKTSLDSKYTFSKQIISIVDPELNLDIKSEFKPVLAPDERVDKKDIGNGYRLRVYFDRSWKMSECCVEFKGIPHGQCLLLYPDGKTKQEFYYMNGKLHGPSTVFSQDGKMLGQSWYIDGVLQGKSFWYYPSGSLYSLQRYRNGIWDGKQEFYYEDGSVKSLIVYKDGAPCGKPLLLGPNGHPEREA